MNDDLRNQIYNNLNLKETDELVEIWQTNDRTEWSDLAFEVIGVILLQRLGELPPQNDPAHLLGEQDSDILLPGDNESSLDSLISQGPPPVFYKPLEVLWTESWLRRAGLAAFGMVVVEGVIGFPTFHNIILSYFSMNPDWSLVAGIIAFVLVMVITAIEGIIVFFLLNAQGSILKILMQMEFNSRGLKV